MAMDLSYLSNLLVEGTAAFEKATSHEELEAARQKYLGSKGLAKAALGAIKEVAKEQRGEFGKLANALNKTLEELLANAKARLGDAKPLVTDFFDITKPGTKYELGHAHIIHQTIDEIAGIFSRLGFALAEGPEVEDERHNFDALNIAQGHPARELDNNFYLQLTQPDSEPQPVPLLLRSQTSTMQVRAMEAAVAGAGSAKNPAVRVIAPGRVYRPDTVDATHHFMFHQIEGLAVEKGLTFADLKSVLHLFVKEYFGADTKTRFRPHYFPFTEVSAEIDINCEMFKHLRKPWLEILGCGMVHPNVLRAVGYDPEQVTGFAFGMGVERIAMLRHGISDIRWFTSNDMRFLRQF